MTPDILKEAERIVRTEFPKRMPTDFVINDVEVDVREGPFCEDYIHVRIILEDDHPEFDGHVLNKFSLDTYAIFEGAGVVPVPTISYSDRSEMKR